MIDIKISAMMCLGQFVFARRTVAYQEMGRETEWRHARQQRVGARPASQYVGRGGDKISLPGVLLPLFTGGQKSMNVLRGMADTGKAWPLVQGDGAFYGWFVIDSISETFSVFTTMGQAERIEFTISLSKVDRPKINEPGEAASLLEKAKSFTGVYSKYLKESI